MFNKKADLIDLGIGIVGLCIFLIVAFGFFLGTICIALKSKIETGKWWI